MVFGVMDVMGLFGGVWGGGFVFVAFIINIHIYQPMLVNIRHITAIAAPDTPQHPHLSLSIAAIAKKNTFLEK